jgi:hypothetical protein
LEAFVENDVIWLAWPLSFERQPVSISTKANAIAL